MTMRKRINGGAPFAANKETKVKANQFSLPKRAPQVNHRRQQTYQPKLQSTWMIIKKMKMMKMRAKWNSSFELENTKNVIFF